MPRCLASHASHASHICKTRIHQLSLFFYRYCSKLPGDRFTHPKPVYTVEEFGKDYYSCKLQLPINCQLRENILVSPLKPFTKVLFIYFVNFVDSCFSNKNKKWRSPSSFLSYKHLKAKLRVFFTGYIIAMVASDDNKITTTYPPLMPLL